MFIRSLKDNPDRIILSLLLILGISRIFLNLINLPATTSRPMTLDQSFMRLYSAPLPHAFAPHHHLEPWKLKTTFELQLTDGTTQTISVQDLMKAKPELSAFSYRPLQILTTRQIANPSELSQQTSQQLMHYVFCQLLPPSSPQILKVKIKTSIDSEQPYPQSSPPSTETLIQERFHQCQ